ncbi:MAG: DUF5671 domain-containing protein [Anaerolineae bacterium]
MLELVWWTVGSLLTCLFPLLAVGAVVLVLVTWTRKGPRALAIDLHRGYFYLISFPTLLVVFASVTLAIRAGISLTLNIPESGFEETRQNLAWALAAVVVSAPVWLFHWRRSLEVTNGTQSNLPRLYLYSVMAVLLLSAVAFGGVLVFETLQVPLGLVDLGALNEPQQLARDVISTGLATLLALGLWLYHWRQLEATPAPTEPT